ncbi:MAG: response regulator transcription factor [Candidatus Omnitrophica bacterium]|nr:response regulator transcription factor [Candidatus Omnitrophota bacterium]
MAKEYQIVLADDHKIFRAGLKSLIDKEAGLKIVGQAEDGEDLLVLLRKVKCDLVVLDLSMPKLEGIAALKVLRQKYPKLKVLILTMFKDFEHFKHAMASGANGYVLKDDAFEQLVRAVKTVMKNKQYVSGSVSAIERDRLFRLQDEATAPSLEILTKREKEILKGIALGQANKNIAANLKISIRTVEAHRGHLTRKLGIKTTADLVKYAMTKNII